MWLVDGKGGKLMVDGILSVVDSHAQHVKSQMVGGRRWNVDGVDGLWWTRDGGWWVVHCGW